jgi:hypothetical protein
MKFRGNQSFKEEPDFIVEFCGIKGDIYPFLAPAVKKRINRSYAPEIDLPVTPKVLRQAFPEQWEQFLLARRIAGRLPPHVLLRRG